jgi:hypothetical protein
LYNKIIREIYLGRRILALDPGIDLEFEETTLPTVEPNVYQTNINIRKVGVHMRV